MNWKLVSAALKAQRTWANLSPEQKERVRVTAAKAAKNAYGRIQDSANDRPGTATSNVPAAESPAARKPAESRADDVHTKPPPDAVVGSRPQSSKRSTAQAAAATVASLTREHGPRLAQQAASTAATRTSKHTAQIVALLRRTQRSSGP